MQVTWVKPWMSAPPSELNAPFAGNGVKLLYTLLYLHVLLYPTFYLLYNCIRVRCIMPWKCWDLSKDFKGSLNNRLTSTLIYIQLSESHPDLKYSKVLLSFVLILPLQQAWEDLPFLQDCGWRWWALWEIIFEQFLADRWGAVKNPE